jgi:hypothetical protein
MAITDIYATTDRVDVIHLSCLSVSKYAKQKDERKMIV